MGNRNFNKILIALVIVIIVGFGAYAFAHWGMGYGHHGWGYHEPGWHHGYYGDPAYEQYGNLNQEEIITFEKQRNEFFKETEDLRQNIYSKELELKSELSKENPDARQAADLQKEISKLESQLDQKRIDHMIEMRKTNPDVGRGFMGKDHMGYGYHYPEACWR